MAVDRGYLTWAAVEPRLDGLALFHWYSLPGTEMEKDQTRGAGEMYTSAAPWDPLFWLVHPTSERLLQYRRLIATRDPKTDDALESLLAELRQRLCEIEESPGAGLTARATGPLRGS
mgnify:CR=1 FL=1